MKLFIFSMTCMVCLIGGSVAQVNEASNSAQIQTVSGCLSKTGKTYVITGGGPGPKQYRISGGNTDALRHKLGHTVAVTGPVRKSNPETQMSEPYHAGSTTGVGYELITAEQVRDIGANCSFTGSTKVSDSR
jgi:hypothetical protein